MDFKIFEKISNTKFHQNPSTGAALFHRTDGDRQRDMTKLIVAFRNFAHASKKWHWHHKGSLGATKLVSNVVTALPPPRPPPHQILVSSFVRHRFLARNEDNVARICLLASLWLSGSPYLKTAKRLNGFSLNC